MISTTQTFDTKALRKTVLDMAYAGSTVHIGCAFSIIELLATQRVASICMDRGLTTRAGAATLTFIYRPVGPST